MFWFWKKKRKKSFFTDTSTGKRYSTRGFLNDIKQEKMSKASSLFNYFK